MNWWENRKYFIKELDNEDFGINHLMGKKEKGTWTYAIVFWRYKVCYLHVMIKNGEAIEVDH